MAASVYYDIDTGSEITPYIGVGGGMSQVTVNAEHGPCRTPGALSLTIRCGRCPSRRAAGIGYAVTEDLTVALGYRLIATLEGNLSKYETTKRKTAMTLNHNVELGLRYSF